MAMNPAKQQRPPENSSRQEFTHSLQLLESITSWHLWSSSLLIRAPAGRDCFAFVSALFSQYGLLPQRAGTLPVRGLLVLLWVASGVALPAAGPPQRVPQESDRTDRRSHKTPRESGTILRIVDHRPA
jgi:hypothetical protein